MKICDHYDINGAYQIKKEDRFSCAAISFCSSALKIKQRPKIDIFQEMIRQNTELLHGKFNMVKECLDYAELQIMREDNFFFKNFGGSQSTQEVSQIS